MLQMLELDHQPQDLAKAEAFSLRQAGPRAERRMTYTASARSPAEAVAVMAYQPWFLEGLRPGIGVRTVANEEAQLITNPHPDGFKAHIVVERTIKANENAHDDRIRADLADALELARLATDREPDNEGREP